MNNLQRNCEGGSPKLQKAGRLFLKSRAAFPKNLGGFFPKARRLFSGLQSAIDSLRLAVNEKTTLPQINLRQWVIVFVLLSLSSCRSLTSYTQIEDYFKSWRSDTASCKEFRSLEQVNVITTILDWKNKNEKFAINILGNPDTAIMFKALTSKENGKRNAYYYSYYSDTLRNNDLINGLRIVKKEDGKRFIYYFDTPCINGLMLEEDNCWVEFHIISNKIKFVGVGCK
ncbi:MAG: hypothetical protein FWH36_05265 [Lentimicrobiaceae bacterium]|nr:hypothetical protein [Lentimicrobiaceae bacterium]